MQKLSLVDETFDLNFTTEYILSIQVSLDGFSFSILDTIQNKVVYLYHQDTFANEPEFQLKKLKTIYEEADLLELPYKKTYLYFVAPAKTTLVPAPLFNPETISDTWNLTFDSDQSLKILSTYIQETDHVAVYGIHHSIFSFLSESHPGTEFRNELNLLSGKLFPGQEFLKVSIHRNQLVILAYQQVVKFYNCFHYEGENDMLYYILGAAKGLNSEPETIILDGMVNKHSAIYHRLRQYFKNVRIAENNSNIHYSYLIDRLPDARFVNLFNSFSCE